MRRGISGAVVLLLAGCSGSGFYDYVGDVTTLPGANPNRPQGDATNFTRVLAHTAKEPPVMLTEPGDVWPGPPPPQPTLVDIQKQQNAELSSQAPQRELPALPGFTLTPPPAPKGAPPTSYPGGVVQLPNGQGVVTGGNQRVQTFNAPGSTGNIVVPNGNGTSTVISPNGTVTTIPTPK
jgi:hypothetical protein